MGKTPIDRTKVQAMLADITAQRERAIAQANTLCGAVDALNAVLSIQSDESDHDVLSSTD